LYSLSSQTERKRKNGGEDFCVSYPGERKRRRKKDERRSCSQFPLATLSRKGIGKGWGVVYRLGGKKEYLYLRERKSAGLDGGEEKGKGHNSILEGGEKGKGLLQSLPIKGDSLT